MGDQCCNLTISHTHGFGCLSRVSLLSTLNLNTQQHWCYVQATYTTCPPLLHSGHCSSFSEKPYDRTSCCLVAIFFSTPFFVSRSLFVHGNASLHAPPLMEVPTTAHPENLCWEHSSPPYIIVCEWFVDPLLQLETKLWNYVDSVNGELSRWGPLLLGRL